MLKLLLSLFLLSSFALWGQDEFLEALSVEVCNCLDGKTSEAVALNCFENLATSKSKTIQKRYDYLMSGCPLLKTVRLENDENEFRWADSRRLDESSTPQFMARKGPPADTSQVITSEPPLVWRAQGTLLAQPGSKGLRLLTDKKRELSFELPSAVARRRDFDRGDEVSLTYRREWRTREGRLVLVVTEIECTLYFCNIA